METKIVDFDIQKLLQSHAPIAQFFLYTPKGTDDTLVKFIDETGKDWNLIVDDEKIANAAIAYLKNIGARKIEDLDASLKHEREISASSNG
jgi:hypothetical protein